MHVWRSAQRSQNLVACFISWLAGRGPSLVGLAVGPLVKAVLAHSDQLVGRQALQIGGDAVDPGLNLLSAQRGGALVTGLIHQIPCFFCNSTPKVLSGATASSSALWQGMYRPMDTPMWHRCQVRGPAWERLEVSAHP